jgi:hypothetical protein
VLKRVNSAKALNWLEPIYRQKRGSPKLVEYEYARIATVRFLAVLQTLDAFELVGFWSYYQRLYLEC